MLQSSYFSSFFGDLLSTPPFSFCVADLKATQGSVASLYHLLDAKGFHSKVRPFILERVLDIPLEALKGISNFSRFLNLHLEISLRNFSKLAQDKFGHWLVGIGFWILHRIQHGLLLFL